MPCESSWLEHYETKELFVGRRCLLQVHCLMAGDSNSDLVALLQAGNWLWVVEQVGKRWLLSQACSQIIFDCCNRLVALQHLQSGRYWDECLKGASWDTAWISRMSSKKPVHLLDAWRASWKTIVVWQLWDEKRHLVLTLLSQLQSKGFEKVHCCRGFGICCRTWCWRKIHTQE